MGKKDVAIKSWLKNKRRFADLFNGVCFNGEQVIKPEELMDLNGELNLTLKDKAGNFKYVQRFRDLCQLWNGVVLRAQLCVEGQDKVHYAMPVKNMTMDAMSYTDQIKSIWDNIPEAEKMKLIGSPEHFSKFRKNDKLCPVITLVFYWGEDWDGNMDLYNMFDLDGIKDNEKLMNVVHKYVPNYHINLFNPENTDDLTLFKTDLQMIFGVLQCKKDSQRFQSYIDKHSNYFRHMDYDSANAMMALLNADKHLDHVIMKGENDMCKALEDLCNDKIEQGIKLGRERGLELGREQGLELGREQSIIGLISKGKLTLEDGAEELGISVDALRAKMA